MIRLKSTHITTLAALTVLPWLGRVGGSTMAADRVGAESNQDDAASVKTLFADPPRDFSSAPLWVWNDWLTEEQVVASLRDLAAHGIRQAFVHPRPGLMTPYLSDEWFKLWRAALREAERLDMNLWIYDENSYPSGFAGGHVPDAMPEARGRGLVLREQDTPPGPADEYLAVFQRDGDGYANVTVPVRADETLGPGPYLVLVVQRAAESPWLGGKCYVDLLYPGVTERFIEVTLEAYRREIGTAFGARVPGTFTDEPHLVPAGGLPWTDGLPEEFARRWGYSLLEHLPALYRDTPDAKQVRHDYYQVLLEQFIAHWARPMHDYCETHHLEFTGHYWEHEWPRARFGPDNMAMYAWHQRPAIDILFNQYSEDAGAQFGNVRAVKELASVANQLGLRRTLCEAYGAGGWDIRLEDLKRIGDWLYVLGVNTLDQHLSYISIRGARKRDHPASFSYHEPWWEAYGPQALYFARLSVALSSGAEVNRVLVLEPTTTTWMYNVEGQNDLHLKEIGDSFQALVTGLSKAQVEYDIGCEDIIARHGKIIKGRFAVGQRSYETVVLPPHTENLNSQTFELLTQFLKANGRVLCCGAPPELVDGRAAVARVGGWQRVEPDELAQRLGSANFAVQRAANDRGLLFHQRRQLADGQILFLVNTSLDGPAKGAATVGGMRSVETWDAATGKSEPYPFRSARDGVQVKFELAPAGSLLLFFSSNEGGIKLRWVETVAFVPPVGPPDIRRVAPNVLTLDYVDIAAGGEAKANTYVYQANQFAFQKYGLERNPWDNAVQFREELISKSFSPDSGLEVTYQFNIEERVPADLAIVIERADLYTITCNGRPVRPSGEWWLDRAFGRVDIAATAQVGENSVTIKAAPFTMWHEVEAAYLLGDFALRATEGGFTVVPAEPLRFGRWNEQGLPFYAAGVTYRQEFEAPDRGHPYRVTLPAWYGSVAKVAVNGKMAGYISAPPYELDVTPEVAVGRNVIEVTVIGTLKNTLGPHHGDPPLGIAWPAMFQKGPEPGPPAGTEYSTVGYGLFEPFVLQRVTGGG
jgi:hypothetical protein